ncbi:MAG: threonine--tRNA ligase, partial [Negativicutes bacterium]|nr:threonine--tRNA ligase [Negativicutes bacterium]
DGDGGETLALRPMTCPFQFMIYKSAVRSYRDLPLRYAETSTLFRNEDSGEMHGLIRVRQFTISEGHIICTPSQLASEFRAVIDLINHVMNVLGFAGDISYRFSRWDETEREKKYIDNPAAWADAESQMRQILDELAISYREAVGEAAFYGPKLDIQFKNVHGKEDTLITVQIDFALPERFDMSYIDADGEKRRPYVIHRTSVGCYERTLAMLIEKYAGAMPLWLAPCQVRLLPVTDRTLDYAREVNGRLRAAGVRSEMDDRNEKIGYKIRDGQLKKIPYLLVVGDREKESGSVAVRRRGSGDIGSQPLDGFMRAISREIADKTIF